MTDRAAEVATKIHFACSHGPHGCSPACVVEIHEAAEMIRTLAAEAVAAEREACAKVAMAAFGSVDPAGRLNRVQRLKREAGKKIARCIRARGAAPTTEEEGT